MVIQVYLQNDKPLPYCILYYKKKWDCHGIQFFKGNTSLSKLLFEEHSFNFQVVAVLSSITKQQWTETEANATHVQNQVY